MRDLLTPIYASDIRPIMRQIFDQISVNSREDLTDIIQRISFYFIRMRENTDYIAPYVEIKNQLLLDRDRLHKMRTDSSRCPTFWVQSAPPDVDARYIDQFWDSIIKINIMMFRVYYLRTLRLSSQNISDP